MVLGVIHAPWPDADVAVHAIIIGVAMPATCNIECCHAQEEEEGFYKFLPANTADRLWQSLSNPAKRHAFVSN